ncbi:MULTISPECIES: serine hydrolase [Sporosarcina]|uniref:Serine hydrolase n=1 Tax=Sporosarcina contaminans TaxID=633403 RepID=A0ABW3U0X9_9BACL
MKRAVAIVLFLSILFAASPKEAAGGHAWAVLDGDTGRLLDGYNENVRLPIASLTKMWTAFTFIESGAPKGEVIISPEAASAEGSSIYLEQGSTVESDTLLYGLMLRSGNDAAYALAEYAGGSVDGFVDLMNEKANLYGLDNTTFTNPSGLHDDEHLSTAYETGLMLYYAMQNEQFKKIASTENFVQRNEDGIRSYKNKHRLIHTNKYAVAGKTGFTKIAGRTLATFFEKDGKKLIIVTLNDGNDWNTHTELADQKFKEYKLQTVAKKGRYTILPGIEGVLKKPLKLLLTDEERERVSHVVYVPRGKDKESIGTWIVSLDHEPLLSAEIIIHQQ